MTTSIERRPVSRDTYPASSTDLPKFHVRLSNLQIFSHLAQALASNPRTKPNINRDSISSDRSISIRDGHLKPPRKRGRERDRLNRLKTCCLPPRYNRRPIPNLDSKTPILRTPEGILPRHRSHAPHCHTCYRCLPYYARSCPECTSSENWRYCFE